MAIGGIHFAPVWPTFPRTIRAKPERRGTALSGDVASQNAPGVATMKASGYQLPVSPLMIFTGLLALTAFRRWRLFYLHCRRTAAICPKPGRAPRSNASLKFSGRRRERFYLLAGWFTAVR